MKVYKKDLNEFIEAVEVKAQRSIKGKYQSLIKESKDARFEKYISTVKEIEKLLLEAHTKSLVIKEEVNYYSNGFYTERKTRESLGSCRNIKSNEIKDNDYEKELNNKWKVERQETELEYLKVKSYIKNNTPKKGYDYLKEIGFDVTSIPVYDDNGSCSTALTTQIDTSKLFVCGDNK